MNKITLTIITIALVLTACLAAYAQNSLYDKLKTVVESDKSAEVDELTTSIASGVSSLLAGVKEGVIKVKSSLEDEILKDAELLAGDGLEDIKDKIQEGLPKLIEELEKAVEATPDDTKLLLKLAVAYKLGGQYSLAITIAEKVLTLDPNSEEAALVIAESYQLKGEIEKGISFLKDFTKEKINDPQLKVYLAALRLEIGDTVKAKEDIEGAILLSPAMPDLYKSAGEIYERTGEKGIKLFVEGKKIDFSKYSNVNPTIKNGSTLIPIRALAENLGADIKYDSETASVNILSGSKEIVLVKDKKTAKVNSSAVKLDEPAQNVNGRILIPLRFVSEQLDKEVSWYPYSKYGIISINNK